jgi:hypothetical protein
VMAVRPFSTTFFIIKINIPISISIIQEDASRRILRVKQTAYRHHEAENQDSTDVFSHGYLSMHEKIRSTGRLYSNSNNQSIVHCAFPEQ